MREATFTVSPNRQYLGIACPTTPVYEHTIKATVLNGIHSENAMPHDNSNQNYLLDTAKSHAQIMIAHKSK